MRIERIEIDGFGRFHDEHWELGEGLTVFVGANEAGKTTLLNAVRALLFGFEASRDGRAWYPALAGGRRGGRLLLRTGSGERWAVERHGERGGAGALAVRAPNGNQGGQETLDRLLHGADKDLFTNIFAFGLSELQTFSTLNADGVRGRIYGAGAGLGGTSAIDLEKRLRQQLEAAFLPGGSKRPLNALLARIEQLRAEIVDLSRQPEEHAAAHREREELHRRAEELRAAARALRERAARLHNLRRAGPVAAELAELEAELAMGDATLDGLPDDAVAILDRRTAELEAAQAVLATIDEELGQAHRQRDAIAVDDAILAVADEVTAVAEERARRVADAARRRDLEAAVARQEATVAEQLARAGGWQEERLLALDDSIPAFEATRAHEGRLERARSARAEAQQRHRAAADELATLQRETAPAVGDDDLEARVAALRELDGLRIARAAARARGDSPGSAALTLGIAAALFVAAVVSGFALAAPIPGILAGAALAGGTFLLLRPRTPDAAASRPEARYADALTRLGLPATAGDADIQSRADEVAAQRARRQLAGEHDSRLEARRLDLERRERDLDDATEAFRAAEAAWEAWVDEHGLPAALSPDAARHLLTAAGTAKRAATEREQHRQQLAALERADASYAERVDALLAGLGIDAAPDASLRDARVVGQVERLAQARADDGRARELDERIAQLAARRERAAGAVDDRQAAVAAHLAALECPDADALRRRYKAAASRRGLRDRLREVRARLAGIAGSVDAVEPLLAEARATDPATLEAAEADAREELERVEGSEREANSRIGALDARIAQLEAAEELGARRQELAALEGEAASMAREWAVRAVALRLLSETRSRYERERQPDVVRAAESHFDRITGGRYARIVAPPGDGTVRVETEGGESLHTDELSRGTGEQLYLALRFGLIEEFARHGEPLPVVMDDILVNFDPDRAARAASAIRDLAERHQVLYFTCHRWAAELLDPDGTRTSALG